MIKAKKKPACPHCGSPHVTAVVYGATSPELKMALKRGRAIVGRCEEWEGQPQWRCQECESEWRGNWIRFKRS